MARYKRIPQSIGGAKTLTAHRDLSDICPACGGYILKGQWYVMKGRAAWHYACKDKVAQLQPKPQKPAKIHGRAEQRKLRKQRREAKREAQQARGRDLAAQSKALAESDKGFEWAIGEG